MLTPLRKSAAPIVATKLYPHQKQALSFLLDRETLVEVPERDPPGSKATMVALWERISDTYGRPKGWRSVVTDLQIDGVRPPPQARGCVPPSPRISPSVLY
mgnify:CR=1 FL=1